MPLVPDPRTPRSRRPAGLVTLLTTLARRWRHGSRPDWDRPRHTRARRAIPGGLAGRARPPRRHRSRGSTLVVALVGGLIAVIGAMLLASRLFSSRFGSVTRSDSLSAREAAEFGLNEVQAQLNSNRFGHLWVTRQNQWWGSNRVGINDLGTCGVDVLDDAGRELGELPDLPTNLQLPDEGSTATANTRVITGPSSANGNTTISYRLTSFTPPSLTDPGNSDVADQEERCGEGSANALSARNFGNLNGGSALISVEGSISRNGRTSSFRLNRSVHVATPAEQLRYSFMILGNAYSANCVGVPSGCTPDADPIAPVTFGAASDISRLNVLDGNICFGTPNGCDNPLTPTIVGCTDLESCLVNNIDTVSTKARNSYCQQKLRVNGKKRKGVICNDYQQAGDLPRVITLPAQQEQNLPTLIQDMKCKADTKPSDNKCDGNSGGGKRALFPYYDYTTVPTSIANLTNANLVKGCYFNNTSGGSNESGATSTAINCIFRGEEQKIDFAGKETTNFFIDAGDNVNLVVHTSLLPVNIFLYDDRAFLPGATKKYAYNLSKAGLENSDKSVTGWSRLRILGRPANPNADGSIPCNQTRLVSRKDNDINGAFIWLPNGSLEYPKMDSKDSSYNVIWACRFVAPTKGSTGYRIITPKNFEDQIRGELIRTVPGFSNVAGGIYRGRGSKDSPG